jgi:ABC-type Fe2+-enterobactin transport system substrate-binding protein
MRPYSWVALTGLLLCGVQGTAHAQQYPLLDRLAGKVVAKYQNSSCQQLAQERGQHPTGRKAAAEQRVIQMLHGDPQMRTEFIDRVAAPIANKLFECGFIP